MALSQSSMNRSNLARPESADSFAMQLALSRVHARLVPMQRDEHGYSLDPIAKHWVELSTGSGFAGYGLGRALRMLLDVLRGLTALHDTFDADGVDFAHGEVAPTHFRVDSEGMCRLVPLTARHSVSGSPPPAEALGHLAPERLLGEPVDARADVFSAGVLLWEALAGRRLFSETSGDAIVERLMGEKLQMPQLPPELAWAIPLKSIAARALAVDPYQRFADCAELATAIAIVARERVATHAQVATFFGPQLRSHGSVAQQRPVPTRSSTFPSVKLPVAPFSITAPPSSRNGFPLATPAPRSVTPPPPSAMPAVRSLSPAPMSARHVAGPQRPLTHKSPFATLLGTGDIVPASHRRKTLTAVGTPLSALAVDDAAPSSAPASSSKLPPALPLWASTIPGFPAAPSPARTSSSAVFARAKLESIPISEVANFRSWSLRRSLILLAVVAVAVIAIAMIATSGSDTPDQSGSQGQNHGAAPLAGPSPTAIAMPELAATPNDHAPAAPATRASDSSSSAPASSPKELRPARAAAPSKPAFATGSAAATTKDYGI